MDGKASTSKGLSPSFPGTSGASLRGQSTKPKRQLGQSKRSFSDLRVATKILERYGGQNDSQVSEKHSQTLEWARKVIRGAEEGSEKGVEAKAPQPDSGVKRQRSQEEDIPQEKRPRIGGGPPKSFSEVAKQAGSIILGVMDSGYWRMIILQINLQHSKAASANLLIHLEQGGADIVLIQEPWLSSNGISGLRTKSYNLVAYSGTGKPRSCILIRKELNAFILPNFSNEDIVTVSLEGPSGKLWLMSVYMAHDDEVEPPPVLLRKTLAEAKRRKIGVIIGTDANSHHTCWGSSDINARAESSAEPSL
ncbi:uncharacterized protein LOC128867231 [Anastrepha ludens]|uniref:uncharacterized protein LOC128867231 n=1 Tax=Anastrepha ludens TaxID=28586 RepID=UPI0023AEAAAA|nr:uncharacterized protein LOC128867231 [Anastrepha ludens]